MCRVLAALVVRDRTSRRRKSRSDGDITDTPCVPLTGHARARYAWRAKDIRVEKHLFGQSFMIRPDEADRNGYGTVRTILNYFQHTAHLNANALNFGVDHLGKEGKTWVLSRLYLSILSPPRFGDTVTLETWPTGIDRLFALRDLRLRDNKGQPLALGTSSWLLIDLASRRILRMDENLSEYAKNPRAVERTLGKIEADGSAPLFEKHLDVRFRDIDVNQHVNNVAFVEWMTEALSFELQSAFYCSEIEVNFLKEAFYGDTIVSRVAPIGEGTGLFYHSLQRQDEDGDIARAKTAWKKIGPEAL